MTRLAIFDCLLCGEFAAPIGQVVVRLEQGLVTARCPCCTNLIGREVTRVGGLWFAGLGAQVRMTGREVEALAAEIHACDDLVGRLRAEVPA